MRKFIASLALLAAALTGVAVQAQTQSRWYWAADFNKWSLLASSPNTYTFLATTSCIPNPYNGGSFGFSTNAPVYINDTGTSANSEIVTPSTVSNVAGSCGFTATTAHTHLSFQVQSGSAGLQEIINFLSKTASYPATVVVDAGFYAQAAAIGSSASSLIAAASGGTGIDILDTTTSPATSYAWNGSAYIKNSAGGSAAYYGNLPAAQWFGYKNTSVTAMAIPTQGAASVGAPSGITAATYRPAQTCVDPLGGETLISSDTVTVTTTSPHGTIIMGAPTCPAGAVGWELYISAASGGQGSEIFYAPGTVAGCTLSSLGAKPSCALTSGSATSALVTGTAAVPLQADAYAMAIEPMDVLPVPYLRSFPPFAVTGVQTYTDPYALAEWSFPAGYLNQVGKSFQMCWDYILTPSSTGTDSVTFTSQNGLGVSANTIATFTSGALTNAAYNMPGCLNVVVAATGASCTAEVHGQARFGLASTGVSPADGYVDQATSTVNLGDCTKELDFEIISTPGSSNVTQGQMRQLIITPTN